MKIFLKKNYAWLLLLILFLLSSWSILHPGYFMVHDFTDGARIAEMNRALVDGHFPVRWTKNFGFGYGMPLFQFYGPLPFYIASFFYWLGFSLIGSIKIIILLSNIGTILGAYLLGKTISNSKNNSKQIGVLAASLLTLAPYRAVNIFVRGALSEVWGLMALPWILWSIVLVCQGKKHAWKKLGLSLVVLFLSHNVTTMIFAPFALVFTIIYFLYSYGSIKNYKKKIKPVLTNLIKGGLLGIGLSSFYLFPAFFEKDYTQVNEIILGNYFDFHLHFLYLRQLIKPFWGYGGSQWGPDDQMSFFLGFAQILVLAIGLLQLVKTVLVKKKKEAIFLATLVGLTGIGFLLTTQKTLFIWEKIDLLAFVQFPWRFIVVILPFLLILAAKILDFFSNRNQLIAFFVLLLTSFISTTYFKPEKYLDNPQAVYYADEKRIRHEMSTTLPDYIPQTMPFWTEIKAVDTLVLNLDDKDKVDEVNVLVDKVQEKLLATNLKQPSEIHLSIADYPQWQIWEDGRKIKKLTDKGHLVIDAKAGDHLYAVKLGKTKLRLISDSISLLSWLLLLIILLNIMRTKRNA